MKTRYVKPVLNLSPAFDRMLMLIALLLIIVSCGEEKQAFSGTDLLFQYEVIAMDLDKGNSTVALTLKNQGAVDLDATGWTLYFNQLSGNPGSKEIGAGLSLERVQGDFWKVTPGPDFGGLKAGATLVLEWDLQGVMTSANFLPFTPFIKLDQKEEAELVQADILPIDNELIPASIRFTAQDRFEENVKYDFADKGTQQIIPSPQSVRGKTSTLQVDGFSLFADDSFQNEATWFTEFMQSEVGTVVTSSDQGSANLQLLRDENLSNAEAYSLTIDATKITITAASNAGAFYGLQSLIALYPVEAFASKSVSMTLPQVNIKDSPAFPYRGFHLDISRNFLPVEAVKKTLKLLAFYKVNTFHLHLTDDEGWRLEIPEIPELTTVGARRGFTEAEEGFIHPAFGSGPDPDADSNYGSGYYTQQDMIEILELAAAHHIQVIPEIDLPGHARAAIIALEHHYSSTGNDQYRLADPEDKSEYLSIQNFPDNVINVCQESTYDFIELVVDNLINIYDQAGQELPIIHIGGDEVPKGVWTASPNCEALLAQNNDLKVSQLQEYFFFRANDLLKSKGIRMAGWQEIVEKEHEGGYEDKSMIPYIWYRADEGYRLANEGYEVVLCNASNLYFDLSYDRDPRETGLHWAGYVDTKKAFEFMPYNFQLPIPNYEEGGNAESTQTILTEKGRGNIYGIQAQLWSETVFNDQMLEYYILPKLIGFAERAWKGEPGWKMDQGEIVGLEKDWTPFASQIGHKELPRLDHLYGGWNYRIPVPGVKVDGGNVEANINFPGFEIRYTTDGSEPTAASTLYDGPVPTSDNLTFRAFSKAGRGGKVSRIQ